MYGYLGNDAVIGTPEIFFSDLAGKPSMKSQGVDCRMVIKHKRMRQDRAGLYLCR